MQQILLISALLSLFLFISGFYCDFHFDEKSSRFDAFPSCTEHLKQNETAAKLVQCPALRPTSNLNDSVDCCQYWRGFACEKDILYRIPGCNSSRFLTEMQVNLLKPANTCAKPPSSCANVTNNPAITTETKIAKKCPRIGSHCYRTGAAPNDSLTRPAFNFVLVVTFLWGIST